MSGRGPSHDIQPGERPLIYGLFTFAISVYVTLIFCANAQCLFSICSARVVWVQFIVLCCPSVALWTGPICRVDFAMVSVCLQIFVVLEASDGLQAALSAHFTAMFTQLAALPHTRVQLLTSATADRTQTLALQLCRTVLQSTAFIRSPAASGMSTGELLVCCILALHLRPAALALSTELIQPYATITPAIIVVEFLALAVTHS